MTTKIIFAADREDANKVLRAFSKARVVESGGVGECLAQAVAGEVEALVIWQASLATGWRAPPDSIVLFTPLFEHVAAEANKAQAAGRVRS